MTNHNIFSGQTRFLGVRSWLNGLYYKSIFVHTNYQQSAFFGKLFLLWVLVNGNPTKVFFFENSAWTMTKALCLNLSLLQFVLAFILLSRFSKKIVNDIQKFTKTKYLYGPLSVSVTIFKSKQNFQAIFLRSDILRKTLCLKAPL